MKVYAVIDTNVIISSMLPHNEEVSVFLNVSLGILLILMMSYSMKHTIREMMHISLQEICVISHRSRV